MKKRFTLFISLILIIAGFLRLYRISEYMTFLGDEGRDVLIVYNILHGKLTLLGPTASVGGFFMGPIYYYFMAPFLWIFNYNPVGPAVMVALFGIATTLLIYKIGSEFFSPKTGLVAAFFYAISPLAIAYSRSSWNPNLMPFFSLLTLYFIYKNCKDKKTNFLFFAGISTGIALQLHYTALFLGAICAVYISMVKIYDQRLKNIQNITRGVFIKYAIFIAGIIIGFSPFLLFEIRHGFPNMLGILKFILFSGETGGNTKFFTTVVDVFFKLFARLLTRFPPPDQVSVRASIIPIDFYFFKINAHVFYLYYPTFLLAVSSVFLIVKKFIQEFKNRTVFLQLLMVLIWLFIGVFIFGFYKKPIYDYYFGFMFPLPFLLVGNLLISLWNKNKWWRFFSIIIFCVLVLLNIAGIPFRSSSNRQLDQVKNISEFVFSKTDGKPFNFALITGSNSDHSYRYFFKLNNHNPVTIENVENDPQRKTVTSQLLLVCELNPCAPLGNSLWEVAGFGRGEIVGQWDVSVVKVYKLNHYKGP